MRRGKAVWAWALGASISCATVSQATIIFQDNFDSYADTAAMNAAGAWGDAGAAAGASLIPSPFGHPNQAGFHTGGAVAQHNFTPTTPTMTTGVQLDFDYWDYATNSGDRYSLGLRSGAAFYEFAEYNALDPNLATEGDVLTQGYGVRTVFVGGPAQVTPSSGGWFALTTTKVPGGWMHWSATISQIYLTVTLDTTDDNVVNPLYSVMVPLTNNLGKPVDNVRFGGPSGVASTGSPGAGWDNIVIQTVAVPEPATLALLGMSVCLLHRRRRAA